jgi:hypothetical protein
MVGIRRFALVLAALGSLSLPALPDGTNDWGKEIDRNPSLRGFRAVRWGAPAAAVEQSPNRTVLFERTYLKDGLMIRAYAVLFRTKESMADWVDQLRHTASGKAITVPDPTFSERGIRLMTFGSKDNPMRTARAFANRVFMEGTAVRTDSSGVRPISVPVTAADLATLRTLMVELSTRAKRLPENKRP